MIKVSVMYPKTAESTFDLAYYRDTHMALVRDRLGDAELADRLDAVWCKLGETLMIKIDKIFNQKPVFIISAIFK